MPTTKLNASMIKLSAFLDKERSVYEFINILMNLKMNIIQVSARGLLPCTKKFCLSFSLLFCRKPCIQTCKIGAGLKLGLPSSNKETVRLLGSLTAVLNIIIGFSGIKFSLPCLSEERVQVVLKRKVVKTGFSTQTSLAVDEMRSFLVILEEDLSVLFNTYA